MKHDHLNIHNMLALDLFLLSQPRQKIDSILKGAAPLPARFPLLGTGPVTGLFTERQPGSSSFSALARYQRKYHWTMDLGKLLQRRHDALVLTDRERRIVWVSKGFRRMRGYTAKEARGRHPSFLQGANTDADSRDAVRSALEGGEQVATELLNYRKNGEAYRCVIDISPLYNRDGVVSHFIALEYEAA
jgi:PAS domain S-box-containing protein